MIPAEVGLRSFSYALPGAFAALFAALAWSAPAGAQSNAVMAESLFQEGKRLFIDKKYDEACPKFAESARLDPSSGVELALGLCYEGQGKTASAWGAYVRATSLARRDNRADREKAAREHATAIEPKLSHVTIDIGPDTASLPGLEVREDGIVVGSEAWKEAPLDPGDHALSVTAPGKRQYRATFSVAAGSDRTLVPVPPLVPGDPDELAAPRSSGGDTDKPPQHQTKHAPSAVPPVGYTVGAAGIASAVAGVILGVSAIGKEKSVQRVCTPPVCSNASAVTNNGTAGTLADWSTGTLIAGAAGVIVGTMLVLLAPSDASADKTPRKTTARLRVGTLGASPFVGLSW